MVVGGLVHANGNIYTVPSTSLTFSNDVTASRLHHETTFKPGDPLGSRGIANPGGHASTPRHDAFPRP